MESIFDRKFFPLEREEMRMIKGGVIPDTRDYCASLTSATSGGDTEHWIYDDQGHPVGGWSTQGNTLGQIPLAIRRDHNF